MLNDKLTPLREMVADAVKQVGHSAPKVADIVFHQAAPKTYDASREEGFDGFTRDGLIKWIKSLFKSAPAEPATQLHFNDVHPDILPALDVVSDTMYFVPYEDADEDQPYKQDRGEFRFIQDLVDDLPALIRARDFLLRKSKQTQKKADELTELIEVIETHMGRLN